MKKAIKIVDEDVIKEVSDHGYSKEAMSAIFSLLSDQERRDAMSLLINKSCEVLEKRYTYKVIHEDTGDRDLYISMARVSKQFIHILNELMRAILKAGEKK